MRGTPLRLFVAVVLVAAAVTIPIVLGSASSAPASAKAPRGSQLARATAPGAPTASTTNVAATSGNGPTSAGNGIFVGHDYHHDLSPPLRDLALLPPPGGPGGFGPPGGGFPPPGGPMMPGAGGDVNTTLPLILSILMTSCWAVAARSPCIPERGIGLR